MDSNVFSNGYILMGSELSQEDFFIIQSTLLES